MSSAKHTAFADRASEKQIPMGAAPSLGYTLCLVAFVGLALIATDRFIPSVKATRVLECQLAKSPNTTVITVDVRGGKVTAQCIEVAAARRGYAIKVRGQ